jgi:hypothetical protein
VLPDSVEFSQGRVGASLLQLLALDWVVELLQHLYQHLAYLLDGSLGGFPDLVDDCAVVLVHLSFLLERDGELVPGLQDVLLEQGDVLLVVVSSLRDFLVLLLELHHVVLQLEDFLLLGVTHVLHLDDAVLEYLVGLLQLTHALLQAGNGLVLLHRQRLHPRVLPRQLFAAPQLLVESGLQVVILGPQHFQLDELVLELLLQVHLLRHLLRVLELQVDHVLLEVDDTVLGHGLEPLQQILVFLFQLGQPRLVLPLDSEEFVLLVAGLQLPAQVSAILAAHMLDVLEVLHFQGLQVLPCQQLVAEAYLLGSEELVGGEGDLALVHLLELFDLLQGFQLMRVHVLLHGLLQLQLLAPHCEEAVLTVGQLHQEVLALLSLTTGELFLQLF